VSERTNEQLSLPLASENSIVKPLDNHDGLYFGADGFMFPEWKDLVWKKAYDKLELYHHGLIEYARHPSFGTIAIPPKKYPSPPERDLQCYTHQLPENFPAFALVHPMITYPRASAAHPIVPEDEGKSPHHNSHFLDAEYFMETIYPPFKKFFFSHLQGFIFEFPEHMTPAIMPPGLFHEKLGKFISHVKDEVRIYVSLPHQDYFTKEYIDLLNKTTLCHTLTLSPGMPTPSTQLKQIPAQPKWAFLWQPIPEKQEDAHKQIHKALEQRKNETCYIIVKNTLDTPSPKAIAALASTLGHNFKV